MKYVGKGIAKTDAIAITTGKRRFIQTIWYRIMR